MGLETESIYNKLGGGGRDVAICTDSPPKTVGKNHNFKKISIRECLVG